MPSTRKPYVTVTLEGPDDGGDFGPNTPGTRTSGFQEAIDYAHAQCRDVHIWGGRGGLHAGEGVPHNVYYLDETLRVPWSQDFTLGGGNYVLAYRGETGSAIHIDSQMNCRYKFGLIVSSSPDPAVCIRPETPGPDDFVVVIASVFDFSCIVSGHPQGTSLLLDATHGPILHSTLFAEETNSMGTGVHLTDAGGKGHRIVGNTLRIPYGNQYHALEGSIGLRLGDPGSRHILHNTFEMSLHAPAGAHFDPEKKAYVTIKDHIAQQSTGADIFAQRNLLTLSFFGRRQPGQDLVFEPEARDNTVHVLSLPNGITNRARIPTNRVIPNWAVGFAVETPPVPSSGETLVNTTSVTVQVMILSPGRVTAWTLADAGGAPAKPHPLSLGDYTGAASGAETPLRAPAGQTIHAGLTPGQTFLLGPGDGVSFTYTEPPAWRWKAVM